MRIPFRFLVPAAVPLRVAAAIALGKAAVHQHASLCSPEEDKEEFLKILTASGLNQNWYQDLVRVGVGTVVDACSAFDGNLTVEPPDATSITALLDGVRHHSTAIGVNRWPADNDPGYTTVRSGLIKMTRFCSDQHPAARARAAAYAGLVVTPPASTPQPETDESMLKNKDENAERLYASAEVLYNRSWASDVRGAPFERTATGYTHWL